MANVSQKIRLSFVVFLSKGTRALHAEAWVSPAMMFGGNDCIYKVTSSNGGFCVGGASLHRASLIDHEQPLSPGHA